MTFRHLILLILTALSLYGCTDKDGQYIRDGREYGLTDTAFREHWWNYYERGKSFADGEFYQEAIRDFHKAVEGREKDQWEVRLDDLHMVDYFPHRELGVISFKRRQYDRAISELEQSLQTAPSARAHYYLNRARGAKIREQERDMSPPELLLKGSSARKTTNNFTHVIKGVAVDDKYVATIEIGDLRISLEPAAKQHIFNAEVPLREGENLIRMIVTDLAGKKTEQTLAVSCDNSGPLVEILKIENKAGSRVIHGVVSDQGGLKSLIINGIPWKITGHSPAYNFKFSLSTGGLFLVAGDLAGNVTSVTLTADEVEDDPLLHPRDEGPEPSTLPRPEAPGISSMNVSLPASTETAQTDDSPPLVRLKDLGPEKVTYENTFLLEGMIADASPVRSFSVNGAAIPNQNGRQLHFSQLHKLAPGDNEFLVAAIDMHGNRSETKINIQRKVRNIRQVSSRLSVAVLPVEYLGEASHPVKLAQDRLIDSFRMQNRFNIIETEKVKERAQGLKTISTAAFTPDKAAESGRKAGVNAVLAVTIIESADSMEIVGRLIDSGTAAILATKDIFGEDKSITALADMLAGLAAQFKRAFPMPEGLLTEVRQNAVTINIGADKGVKPGMLMICYRDGLQIKHPVTGRYIGAEPEILGEIRITEVFEKSATGVLLNPQGKVMVYDRVIAR